MYIRIRHPLRVLDPGFQILQPWADLSHQSWTDLTHRSGDFYHDLAMQQGELIHEIHEWSAWWFWTDHDDFHIFTAVYIDAICPAFVFRYDPEKKNCRPRRGTKRVWPKVADGIFHQLLENWWWLSGEILDFMGSFSRVGFIGIQIWIPWRKKNAQFSSMILPLKPPCIVDFAASHVWLPDYGPTKVCREEMYLGLAVVREPSMKWFRFRLLKFYKESNPIVECRQVIPRNGSCTCPE